MQEFKGQPQFAKVAQGLSYRAATAVGNVASAATQIQQNVTQAAKAFRAAQSIKPDDVIIAIMGVTGAGKTSFIDHLTDERLEIGKGLKSCTAEIGIHRARMRQDGRVVWLVDTPGFDDTYKSDTEILREIAEWLVAAYENQVLLTGIVYLHRISDPRVGNSAMKNLRMFRKLVGPDGLGRVVLATTFWSSVTEEQGLAKQQQLMGDEDFWGYLLNKGSQVWRHDGTADSALAIVDSLIYLQDGGQKVTLAIQQEVVNEGKMLNETAAGQTLESELIRQRREFEAMLQELRESMAEAISEKDREWEMKLRVSEEVYMKKREANDPELLKMPVRKMQCVVM